MSRTRGHTRFRTSFRVPRVLGRETHNLWLDWPYAGPAPGRSLRPFVRAAKRSENQRVREEMADDARSYDVCGEYKICDWCAGAET
jgi:hypothetical protein